MMMAQIDSKLKEMYNCGGRMCSHCSNLLMEVRKLLDTPTPDVQGRAAETPAKFVERLARLGCLVKCSACKGRGDRHIESAIYSGQSTCPNCGADFLRDFCVRATVPPATTAEGIAERSEVDRLSVVVVTELLAADMFGLRKLWNRHLPEADLEKLANQLGYSFD